MEKEKRGKKPKVAEDVQTKLTYNELQKRTSFLKKLKHDSERWSVRRTITIVAFVSIIVMLVYYSTIGNFIGFDEVKKISEFNSIIITIVGFLASIIAVYFGMGLSDRLPFNKNKQTPVDELDESDRK